MKVFIDKGIGEVCPVCNKLMIRRERINFSKIKTKTFFT